MRWIGLLLCVLGLVGLMGCEADGDGPAALQLADTQGSAEGSLPSAEPSDAPPAPSGTALPAPSSAGGAATASPGYSAAPSPSPVAETSPPAPQSATPKPFAGAEITPSPSAVQVSPSADPSEAPDAPSEVPSLSPAEGISVKAEGPDGLLLEVVLDPAGIATAFDAIKAACDEAGIELSYSGSGQTAYISAIGGYRERSEGGMSGWIYKVNGEHASRGCGQTEVAVGDRVSFYFSRDMGKDVKDRD